MEQETVDPIYKKGFEHGYWLELGDRSDLKKHLEEANKNKSYGQGLKAGSKEAVREKFRERMNEADKAKAKDKDKDKGMEM